MLIVSQAEMDRIRSGRQTLILQTGERPCYPSSNPQPIRVGYNGDIIWAVIPACDQVTMGSLTEADAHDLGCNSLAAHRSAWNARRWRDAVWHPDLKVWKSRVMYGPQTAQPQQITLF